MKKKYIKLTERHIGRLKNAIDIVYLANGKRSISEIADELKLSKAYVSILIKWIKTYPNK